MKDGERSWSIPRARESKPDMQSRCRESPRYTPDKEMHITAVNHESRVLGELSHPNVMQCKCRYDNLVKPIAWPRNID